MHTALFPTFSHCGFHHVSGELRKDLHEHDCFIPKGAPAPLTLMFPDNPLFPAIFLTEPNTTWSRSLCFWHYRLSWNAASCTHPSSNSVWSLPQCSASGEQEQEWFSLRACMHLHCHLEVCCHTPVQPAAYKQHSEKDRTNGLHADSSKVKLHGNSSMSFFPRQWQKKKPQTKGKPLIRGIVVFLFVCFSY